MSAPRRRRSIQPNVRTVGFREMFDALPADIRRLAAVRFRLFVRDPAHHSLRLHALHPTAKGSHAPHSFSVSINMQYRAVYRVDGTTNVWYWVGTHAQYNRLIGDSERCHPPAPADATPPCTARSS